MSATLAALAPVFAVVAAGFAARRLSLVPADAWGVVNTFGYRLLYPAFLFHTIATADLQGAEAGLYLTCLLIGFSIAGAAAFGWLKVFGRDGPAFTSVYQGAIRWNGFVLLAAADALYGPQGTALIALGFGPTVVLVNVACVFVMARWADNDAAPGLAGVAGELARNPLVLACAAGMAADFTGLSTHLDAVLPALKLVGAAAMPVALLCVGAALTFETAAARPREVAASAASKLVVAPAIMLGVALALGLSPLATAVAVGVASTPTAAAAYVLARAMGGDAPLMAGIVTTTTLLAAATIPVWVLIARALTG